MLSSLVEVSRRLERFLYVIGLSLAVIYTQWTIIKYYLMGFTNKLLVSHIVCSYPGCQCNRNMASPEDSCQGIRNPYTSIYLRQFPFLGLAIVMIGFALILTLTPQSPHNIQGYTSLWILPESDSQSGTHPVGIHSQELRTTRYDLEVTYNGQTVKKWLNISLAPGLDGSKVSPCQPDKVL